MPSSTQTLWLTGRLRSSCTNPLGQRIDARTGPLASPSPKNTSLLCWDKKSRSRLQHARLAARFGFHRDRGPDGVAIALCFRADGMRWMEEGLSRRSSKGATAGHCDFLGILPAGHHDRNRRGRMTGHLRENPDRRLRKHRKTFHRDCSRRRYCARIRSKCRRNESAH